MTPFVQASPNLGHPYDDDRILRSHLRRVLPPEVLHDVEPSLRHMGELAGGELWRMHVADRLHEPVLTTWSPWGERIDHIELTPLWQQAEKVAATEGLVATAYEAKHGVYSRTHQFALVYLFAPSTDVYTCPLAMTDGAARTLLESGNQALIDRAVPHLTSRDPTTFWTSGQWMTESTGGSDVGRSETVAIEQDDGSYALHGRKWFTSAATSQMALTLARPEGNPDGGRGLALFYLETRDDQGRLRNILVHRLKDKLGTRKVPTAELTLQGTPARLVGEPREGTRAISPMLNLTRTWNAVCAASGMARGMALARDYAKRRVAFGDLLIDKPLHLATLTAIEVDRYAAFHLAFAVVEQIGLIERGKPSELDHALLRVLTPLAKLYTAKLGVAAASEVLECFGGAGYVEDTGLPLLLRDAQVLPIWEGTTNVLSLDVLRLLARSPAPDALRELVTQCRRSVVRPELVAAVDRAIAVLGEASAYLAANLGTAPTEVEAAARSVALTIAAAVSCALVARQAEWSAREENDGRAALAATELARRLAFVPPAPRDAWALVRD